MFEYIGICATTFEKRHNNHKSDLKNRSHRGNTSLSNKVWDIKDKGHEFSTHFSKIARVKSYRPGRLKCGLC